MTETHGSVIEVVEDPSPVAPLAISLSYIDTSESLPAFVPPSSCSVTPVPEPPHVCEFALSLSPRPHKPRAIALLVGGSIPPAVIGVPVPADAVPTASTGVVPSTPA